MKSEINIKVNVSPTIDDETAQMCLNILSMWQKTNPDKAVRFHHGYYDGVDIVTYAQDGTIEEVFKL